MISMACGRFSNVHPIRSDQPGSRTFQFHGRAPMKIWASLCRSQRNKSTSGLIHAKTLREKQVMNMMNTSSLQFHCISWKSRFSFTQHFPQDFEEIAKSNILGFPVEAFLGLWSLHATNPANNGIKLVTVGTEARGLYFGNLPYRLGQDGVKIFTWLIMADRRQAAVPKWDPEKKQSPIFEPSPGFLYLVGLWNV